MGVVRSVITQNIDGLHQKAGSRHVLELHGNAREAVCLTCDCLVKTNGEMIDGLIEREEMPRCPHCDSVLKPNAVLYGEMLPMRTALRAQVEVERCDLMLIAGSSLLVSPAAQLPFAVLQRGGEVIVVNQQATTADPQAAVVFREDVAEILPRLLQSYGEARGEEAGLQRAIGWGAAE
jgi:NAD-dependent deacetylase